MDSVRIDHVIIGVSNLDEAAARFEKTYGLRPVVGGRHPGGTANRSVPLAPPQYLELLTAQPDSEAEEWLSPMLVDGDRIVGWAIEVDDIAAVGHRLGRPASPGGITHEDGSIGAWRTVGGVSPNRPFFIAYDADRESRLARWQDRQSGGDQPVLPGAIEWIELGGDESRLRRWIGADQLPLRFVGGEPGVRAVGISMPGGDLIVNERLD